MPSPLRGFEKLPLARQMHSPKVRSLSCYVGAGAKPDSAGAKPDNEPEQNRIFDFDREK
jgi:hypothetical protein